mgnify:CR=1 FL=1
MDRTGSLNQTSSIWEGLRKAFGRLFPGAQRFSIAARTWSTLTDRIEESDEVDLPALEAYIDVQALEEEEKAQLKANLRQLVA